VKRKKLFGRRNGRGSVLLISSLLIGSAVIRVGTGASQAVATENLFAESQVTETSSRNGGLTDESRAELAPLLDAFQKRELRLSEKEHQLEMRLKALQVADEQIERRLVVLQNAEESLRSMLAIANTAAEDDLTRLTSVYENMKPKDAAALFETMEPAFAAGFLGRMRPDSAAGIMAGLTPEAAYSVSVILAGRNAKAPKT
jgi:flagellar motility protein MotE (MotC chaperone)